MKKNKSDVQALIEEIRQRKLQKLREVGLCIHCRKMIQERDRWHDQGFYIYYETPSGVGELRTGPMHVRCEREHNRQLVRQLFMDYTAAERRTFNIIKQYFEQKKEVDGGSSDRND